MSTFANPVTLPLVQYSPKHFLLTVVDGVASVTLNRPERKNPLTFESYRELTDFFRACAMDDEVKTIVISGAGGNFSSGGDVFEIIGPLVKMDTKGLTAFTRMTGDLVKAMRACPQPIIAAVEGICAGAGADAFDRGNDRLRTGAHHLDQIAGHAGKSGQALGVHFHQRANDLEHIAAGGKIAAGAGDHHGLDFVIHGAGAEEIRQFPVTLEGQRILALGAVQGD